jgi:RNA-directed DNA polymerase
MDDLRKTQESFARKAKAQPEHRFADLYHLVCHQEWLAEALREVLNNAGSRTAGIDGVSRKQLADEEARTKFIENIRTELRAGTYRPQPVRRHWIPKANGKRRPLGIPTIKDRVVQMVLKMLLEPIWESDFLDCSNGFRPGRRTMDCVRTCQSRITTRNKYLWIIEGDIKGCFDHVQHAILLKHVRRRVRDERVVGLIEAMLRAGVMEGRVFQATPEGTPQGGILSPLLANIYLHELDQWWWRNYGNLTPYQKQKRRKAGVGNCILTRYADDFVLLCNGPHEEVKRLREEIRQVLWNKLQLELSVDKTNITHATDGFDFLGYHVQWKLPKHGKPWLRITPSKRSVERFKRTVKDLTRRQTFYQSPLEKIDGLNRVMRGWNQYYEYVNATSTANKLTYWANDRLFIWLKKRHKKGGRWVVATYRHREEHGRHKRWNLGVKDDKGQMVFLYHMTDLHRHYYYSRTHPHPYLSKSVSLATSDETPFPAHWDGRTTPDKADWADLRLMVLARDSHRCGQCGSTAHLHVHHIRSRRHRGANEMGNLQTLCDRCHARTPSWGRPRGTGSTQARRAG